MKSSAHDLASSLGVAKLTLRCLRDSEKAVRSTIAALPVERSARRVPLDACGCPGSVFDDLEPIYIDEALVGDFQMRDDRQREKGQLQEGFFEG